MHTFQLSLVDGTTATIEAGYYVPTPDAVNFYIGQPGYDSRSGITHSPERLKASFYNVRHVLRLDQEETFTADQWLSKQSVEDLESKSVQELELELIARQIELTKKGGKTSFDLHDGRRAIIENGIVRFHIIDTTYFTPKK
jgi:hypothetical protein